MNKSKRIFYFDNLRAIAIIGIIFCHASVYYIAGDMGTINFYFSAFYDCFRDFSIPIFVMLSGALLIGKKDSLVGFFKRRLSRIFIPFIFWYILYIIYSFIFIKKGIDLTNAIDIFLGKTGTLGVAFWFIWMIIIAYIAIFIINKFLAYAEEKGLEEKLINILTALSVIYIVMFQLHLFGDAYYSSILTYYISFIPYTIIGYFLANKNILESKISTNKLVLATLILSVGLYCSYVFGYVVPESLQNNSLTTLPYFNVLILAMSSCIFLMFKYLSRTEFMTGLENGKMGNAIMTLSKYSYGIYLAHYLVLFFIRRIMVKFIDISTLNSIIWIPIFVALTLTVSFVALYILDKIPYLERIAGTK